MELIKDGLIISLDDMSKLNWNRKISDWHKEHVKDGIQCWYLMIESEYNGKKVKIYLVRVVNSFEFGYMVEIDGKPEHLVSIYEPAAVTYNERGIVTCVGHEELITLYLDNGEFDLCLTR